jgi:hypothetical protein
LIKAVERILISAITLPLRADVRHSVSLLLHSLRVKGRKSGASNAARLAPNSLASDFSVSVFSFSVFQNGFRRCARAICVAAAVLARLLRLVSSSDQANCLLDPACGAGLSVFVPEARGKKATSSQGRFGDCCFS